MKLTSTLLFLRNYANLFSACFFSKKAGILLLVVSVSIFSSAAQEPPSPAPFEQADNLTDETTSSINLAFALADTQSIHYAYSGDTEKPGILFIHGTPGRWAAFSSYLASTQLQREFFMVSIDRPQWGESTLSGDQDPTTFATQADAINLIFQDYPDKKWILVGHSLGASIAPKVVLKAPDAVAGILLLAGSISPSLGKPRWYNHVANNMFVKWLVPARLRDSNKEIMPLRKELALLKSELEGNTFNTDITQIQGMKDTLVSPKNTAYVRDNWEDKFNSVTIIELEEEGHFLPWRQPNLIVEQLRRMTNNN